jgi:integrase
MQLTDITVRQLRAPDSGQRLYRDDGLAGFGVRVSQGGTKTFVLVHGRQRQFLTIGRYPIISLAQARDEAKRFLAERTLGQHQPKTIKFEDAYELFKQHHCARKKERTSIDYQYVLNRHFLPKLRGERLEDISTHTLAAITDKLLDRPSEHTHAQAVARTFFRWAVRRRYLRHSPLEGIQIAQGRSRDRVLDDAELRSVYRLAREYGYPFGTIVQLLILTGQRRGEIAALRTDWINFKERTLTLPPSITKNGREHTFPFGPVTKTLLEDCPSFDGVLFPARGNSETTFSGWSKCKFAFDAKLKNVAPWTLHDLRRTFSSGQAALGTPPHVTERMLNHVSGTISGVAAVYNRFQYTDEMREGMKAWEQHLTSAESRQATTHNCQRPPMMQSNVHLCAR